ncbi:arginase family protein [Pseudonocardia sp. CA-107938]|uniref:arginase family protein n=1 Tax=Pseudonocardia sp. CA-107938 TaxID=3240021 RepID=UPI003D8D6DB7
MSVLSVPFHLDERLPDFEPPLRPDLVLDPPLPAGGPWERMAVLYEQVAQAVAVERAAGRVPIVLSGDCTTSLGVVAGLQRAGTDPALVWFDAHGDVQTPQTSTSGYLGGMPIRQLVGGADRTVPDALALRPVAEADVVLVDGRDLDPPEAEFLAGSAIRHVGGDAVPLPDRPCYLHLDVDVCDPAEVPGLLFPVPGGVPLAMLGTAVRRLLDTGDVVAIGLACTYRPGSGATPALAEFASAHLP